MNEGPPEDIYEEEVDVEKERKIALALELSESEEGFDFPGINDDDYAKMKETDEEFPGYTTPIDEIIERCKSEGIKVVLGKNPSSGNVYILPKGSDDIENDSISPRQLSTEGEIDEALLKLILS